VPEPGVDSSCLLERHCTQKGENKKGGSERLYRPESKGGEMKTRIPVIFELNMLGEGGLREADGDQKLRIPGGGGYRNSARRKKFTNAEKNPWPDGEKPG